MIFALSTYFWSWSVYIMRTSSMTEAWTTEAKVKNTLKSEFSWPALVYVTWWTKSIQRPGNDDPWSALREIELTSIVLMNRLARGVSSISSKCSSTGACFPFGVSVSYSHAVYNSLFTPPVHPSFFSREKTVTVLTHCRSAGQTCTRWCIRRERLFGLSCQKMSETCENLLRTVLAMMNVLDIHAKRVHALFDGEKTMWSAVDVSKQ